MPGSTPLYGLPYPVPGDPIAEGADTIRALAETVEDAIAAGGGGGGGGGGAVASVNGKTGIVTLDAADVGALPDTYTPGWSQITGKPATFPPTTGTTAATAKPGNWTPAWSDVSGKPATFPPTTHPHTPAELGAVANGGGVATIVAVSSMPTTPDPNTVYIVRP